MWDGCSQWGSGSGALGYFQGTTTFLGGNGTFLGNKENMFIRNCSLGIEDNIMAYWKNWNGTPWRMSGVIMYTQHWKSLRFFKKKKGNNTSEELFELNLYFFWNNTPLFKIFFRKYGNWIVLPKAQFLKKNRRRSLLWFIGFFIF